MGRITPKMLIVDDEPEIAKTLRRLFRREGFEVELAESGQDGLTKLASFPADVIISDFRMPEMNGAEFLSRTRQMLPYTLRFILSGYADLDAVLASIHEGEAYRFLHKPWDDDALVKLVVENLDLPLR